MTVFGVGLWTSDAAASFVTVQYRPNSIIGGSALNNGQTYVEWVSTPGAGSSTTTVQGVFPIYWTGSQWVGTFFQYQFAVGSGARVVTFSWDPDNDYCSWTIDGENYKTYLMAIGASGVNATWTFGATQDGLSMAPPFYSGSGGVGTSQGQAIVRVDTVATPGGGGSGEMGDLNEWFRVQGAPGGTTITDLIWRLSNVDVEGTMAHDLMLIRQKLLEADEEDPEDPVDTEEPPNPESLPSTTTALELPEATATWLTPVEKFEAAAWEWTPGPEAPTSWSFVVPNIGGSFIPVGLFDEQVVHVDLGWYVGTTMQMVLNLVVLSLTSWRCIWWALDDAKRH